MKDLYDVAVVGGGLCGFACAFKAAQNGREVLLVERRPVLGWESTWAYQLDLDRPRSSIAEIITEKLSSIGGLKDGIADGPILEILLNKIAKEAENLTLLLYSYPIRLIFEGDKAYGVVLGTKSGERIVKAKVIVDATEEAILWRGTGVEYEVRGSIRSKGVIFFNHVEPKTDKPISLGDGIVVRPSIWRGEARVEFDLDRPCPLEMRRCIPEVISRVRDEVTQLRDALLTHTSNEPFPTGPIVKFASEGPEHPDIANLLGAGIWAVESDNTPQGRLAIGEEVGEIASRIEGVSEFPDRLLTGSILREPQEEADVIVVGGGTGGAIAAIAAGREGADVTLIEGSTSLGGIGTGGAIHIYCVGAQGGIQDEVDRRVAELSPLFCGRWKVKGFHPEAKKIVLQQMAEEEGVRILLNTLVTGVLTRGVEVRVETAGKGRAIARRERERRTELEGLIAVGPEGVRVYRGKVFVDSTGDGDVAVMAGAPFIVGRQTDNLMHTYSQPAGRIVEDGGLGFLNFDVGYVDPTDVEDLTRGRIDGVLHYWREDFDEGNRLLYIAPIIGIRQSRHIIGEYQITLADEIAGRRFEDAVSFMRTFYDNHGSDYENESDEARLWVWALGNWNRRIGCDVPYRALLPRKVERLLLACRAVSMTYDAHAGFRMQRDIQRIGEAAGVAAAMAAKAGITPRQIEVKTLQAKLRESGLLDEKHRIEPAIPDRKAIGKPDVSSLKPEEAKDLVWISSHKGEEGISTLRNLLSSSDPKVRFAASAALALKGSKEGVAELLDHLRKRTKGKTDGNKAVPIWQAAISFLGAAGDRSSVPALIQVLEDREAHIDAIIAAVRALGRIGDRSAIPALRDLLRRDDLPTERPLQISTGGPIKPAVEDAEWQIRLATAESLAKLGVQKEEIAEIVKPWLEDPRAYVRRYARKILGMIHD